MGKKFFRFIVWGTAVWLLGITVGLSQQLPARLHGTVQATDGSTVAGATVQLEDGRTLVTDEKGRFSVSGIAGSEVSISIYAVGFKTLRRSLQVETAGEWREVFTLTGDMRMLDVAEIFGYSKVDEINKSAYNVTAVDARKLHSLSTDVGQVLNRVSGVKIREAGGMGSQTAISLNGYSGNQVKLFIDGLPMDQYGSSFQLNNIPINYIERVEVYKGVVPVWLGGDALGGAINLVKSTRTGSFLETSYSLGSFNTHRLTLNAGLIRKNGFTVELNSYANYSDNKYWVDVDVVPDINTGVTIRDRVRRFHDQYKNYFVGLNVGISNKPWADQLLLGMNIGENHADIQTGNRMPEVYGARFREGMLVQPTLLYRKDDFLLQGLDVTLRGSFNFGEEKSVDTVYRRYNWYGESVPKGVNSWDAGGERTQEFYRYRNHNGNAVLNLKYQMSSAHALVLNSTFTSSNRTGLNELQPDNDFYKQPKMTQKNILGLGYAYQPSARWSANLFAKHFFQHVKAYSVYNDVYSNASNNRNHFGFGAAASYQPTPHTQFKLSYEKAYRVPELNELFGDVINLEANPDLKPEGSHNLNLGASHYIRFGEKSALNLNGGVAYRYASDFIRYVLSAVNFDGVIRQVAQNQRDVSNLGFDAEIRYTFDNRLLVGGNATYQNLRNRTKYETSSTDVSIFYKDRLPNIPYLFGSADIGYRWQNVFMKQSNLTVSYSLFYVHAYYLRWPSAGASGKEMIPKQLAHDLYVNYSLKGGRYHIGLEGRNLTDELLYDNYMLQKPSRNFSIKFMYSISN